MTGEILKSGNLYVTFLIMCLVWTGAFVLVNFLNSIYYPEYFRPYWVVVLWSLFSAILFTSLFNVGSNVGEGSSKAGKKDGE